MPMNIWKRMTMKEDPSTYEIKDAHLARTLRVRDFLGLGVGTIVSASIFTLPGEVAAQHTGPAVVISFIIAFKFTDLFSKKILYVISAYTFPFSFVVPLFSL